MKNYETATLSRSLCETRKERVGEEQWILPFLKSRSLRSVTELGTGSGRRALWLLPQLSGEVCYRGFEPSPEFVSQAKANLEPARFTASVEVHSPAYSLPIEDASQDLVLALDLIDSLRMDQLYMTLAEARRILAPEGIFVLCTLQHHPGQGGKFAAFAWDRLPFLRPAWAKDRRLLNLHHYISPEDWKVIGEKAKNEGLVRLQRLALVRI